MCPCSEDLDWDLATPQLMSKIDMDVGAKLSSQEFLSHIDALASNADVPVNPILCDVVLYHH